MRDEYVSKEEEKENQRFHVNKVFAVLAAIMSKYLPVSFSSGFSFTGQK
jgi:hypothetical protein